VRSIAAKRGMSVVELNHYMETHPEIDNEIDNGLVELGKSDKCLVIDSRMAWHFTEGTFKVYLSTDVETSALRIMSANRAGEHSATLEDTVSDTKARRESEKKRYKEQYGVDIKDLTNYSLIVDTTVASPAQVA
jgi:cytidylate kinase